MASDIDMGLSILLGHNQHAVLTLQHLMIGPPEICANNIQHLTHNIGYPPLFLYGPTRSEGNAQYEAFQHAVTFIANLHPNHDNFLSCISMYSPDRPLGLWNSYCYSAFKNIAVGFLVRLPILSSRGAEVFLYQHPSTLVDRRDIRPGRVPHAVVKIYAELPNGRRTIGTGAIINKDVVLTSAHNLISAHGYAVSFTVIVGYGEQCQVRYGVCAVVHGRWYAMRANANDIGLIKLDRPLDNVQPLRYRQAPKCSDPNMYVKIYGFPKDEVGFEPHGQLCETRTPIHYNPSLKMIEHFGDTLPGNSGSPVINSSNIIAVHFGSGFVDGRTVNLAVAIERNGNNITALRQALNMMLASSSSPPRHHQHNINVQQLMGIRDAGGLIFAW